MDRACPTALNSTHIRQGAGGEIFMSEPRVERRLAAILAGDVVGYSRLMALDDEGTPAS